MSEVNFGVAVNGAITALERDLGGKATVCPDGVRVDCPIEEVDSSPLFAFTDGMFDMAVVEVFSVEDAVTGGVTVGVTYAPFAFSPQWEPGPCEHLDMARWIERCDAPISIPDETRGLDVEAIRYGDGELLVYFREGSKLFLKRSHFFALCCGTAGYLRIKYFNFPAN